MTTVTKLRPLPRNLVLLKGAHSDPQDGMCVMEAVAYIAREPFTDHPECASPIIGAFARAFNDRLSEDARQKLRPYVWRIAGSKGTAAQERERRVVLIRWLYGYAAPLSLRAIGLNDHADKVEKAAADAAADADAAVADVADAAADAAADADAAVAAADAAADAAVAAVAAADAAAAAEWPYYVRYIPWRCLRVLAYRACTVKGKTYDQNYAIATKAMEPLADALNASAWKLLDDLLKVTE